MPSPTTHRFTFERETKGAVKYLEEGFNPGEPDKSTIGTLYIRKAALRAQGISGIPQSFTLTIQMET